MEQLTAGGSRDTVSHYSISTSFAVTTIILIYYDYFLCVCVCLHTAITDG